MDKASIAIRAQDFHEGLRGLRAYGPKEAYLRNTLLIGKTATLATHIKGIDYIENNEALYGLAAELGINGTELEVVLRTLEEADFARIVGSPSNFTRIELRVPELRNSYEELGEQWLLRKPGELEVAAVSVLDQIVSVPKEKSAFQRNLGLDQQKMKLLVELGANGGLIDEFASDDGEVFLYSPLTMEESPQAVVEVCKRFERNEIARTLNAVRGQQGVPLKLIKDKSAEVANVGIKSGLFCPVEIEMNGHEYTFVFTPRGNLTKEERVILDKARAILACVRCGEHFVNVRPVHSPVALLQFLIEHKTFRYPRTDVPEQYGLLVKKQVATVSPDRYRAGHWHLHIIDTPENMRAMRVALDLLQDGDVPTTRMTVDRDEYLNVSGSYAGTLTTRAKLAGMMSVSTDSQRRLLVEISKLAQGVMPR